jgi:hypothetical protein
MAPGARGVRVYAGPGAGATPLAYALDGLRAALPPQLTVAELHAEELLQGGWEDSTGAWAWCSRQQRAALSLRLRRRR